jgi:hypothetical protein
MLAFDVPLGEYVAHADRKAARTMMTKKKDDLLEATLKEIGPKTWSDAELLSTYQEHRNEQFALVEFCCTIPGGMEHFFQYENPDPDRWAAAIHLFASSPNGPRMLREIRRRGLSVEKPHPRSQDLVKLLAQWACQSAPNVEKAFDTRFLQELGIEG